MKNLMFALLAFGCLSAFTLAQDAATEKQDHKGATKSVTGCLQKGHEAGEFSITGEDGKTWELVSKTVKLEEHVGHQVTVTGSAHKETKAEQKAEEKKKGQMEKAAEKEEYGDLRVSDLKMVSATCK